MLYIYIPIITTHEIWGFAPRHSLPLQVHPFVVQIRHVVQRRQLHIFFVVRGTHKWHRKIATPKLG